MCAASQQVTRKVFDYNAYIQGRLRGEYVVIYHTVIEVSEEIYTDIQVSAAVVPIQATIPDVQDPFVISITLAVSKASGSTIWKGTISGNVPTRYYRYDATHHIPFTKATFVNCRGAPQ